MSPVYISDIKSYKITEFVQNAVNDLLTFADRILRKFKLPFFFLYVLSNIQWFEWLWHVVDRR